jgi:hypothetical protein
MSTKTRDRIVEIIAALLILLFTYTAISKLSRLNTFRATLSSSPWIGNHAIWLSLLLPATELLIALMLFIPFARLWGLCVAFILMGLFTGYIALMLSFTPDLPCSCGGVLKQMSWSQHLVFNIFLLLLTITGILLSAPNKVFIAINPASAPATAGSGRRSRKPV